MLEYDDVIAAIAEEFWKLAPVEFYDHGHRDLVFGVTHQDLMAAVENGIEAARVAAEGG